MTSDTMKKLLLFFTFLIFQGAVMYGQTLSGTWQGVLKRPQAPDGEQRVVIKVSSTEADNQPQPCTSSAKGPQPLPQAQ